MKSYATFLNKIGIEYGDITIDCGANIGHVTNALQAAGALVYAFEPEPNAFKVLAKRFGDNYTHVTCINAAVMNREGKVKLYLHRHAQQDPVKWSVGASTLSFKENVDNTTYKYVRAIRLSTFIKDLDTEIRLIKMDIEGMECAVIHDLIDTRVIHRVKTLLVETHTRIRQLRPKINKLKKRIEQEKLTNIKLNWV